MKLIIAGSRILDFSVHGIDDIVYNSLREKAENIKEIVSGKAKGIDTCGEEFAKLYNIN